jgi:hypothetical protein
MHSCVTRKAAGRGEHAGGCGGLDAGAAQQERCGARDHHGQRQHARALEVERGREGEDHEARGSNQREPKRQGRRERRAFVLGDRLCATGHLHAPRLESVCRAHPGKNDSGDGDRQHHRPHVDVQRVEPQRRCHRASECADADDIERDDRDDADRGAGGARAPGRRVRDDRGETQRQRVGAAAGERGFDGQHRGTEQCRSGHRLQLRRRQEDMGADPWQTEQAE